MNQMFYFNNGKTFTASVRNPTDYVRLMQAPIMANAVRTAQGVPVDYEDAIQEGAMIVLEALRSWNGHGPFATYCAPYLMGIRDAGRGLAIFEAEHGKTIELDAPLGSDDDNWDPEDFWSGAPQLSQEEPEFEIPDESGNPDRPESCAMLSMTVGDPLSLDDWGKLDNVLFLATVLDYLFGVGPKLEAIASQEEEEHIVARKPWSRDETFSVFAEEEPVFDEYLAGDHEERQSAFQMASEDEPYEDHDFFDMEFSDNPGLWIVGCDRTVRYASTRVYPKPVRIMREPEWTWVGQIALDETDRELNEFLDGLSVRIPSQAALRNKWEEFWKALATDEETHLSKAYQFGVVKALTEGYSLPEARQRGKEAHRIASGQAKLTTSKTVAFKKGAPKGALAAQAMENAAKSATRQRHEFKGFLKTLTGLPSKASFDKARTATNAVKVLKVAPQADGSLLAAADITSSSNGPKPYRTYVNINPLTRTFKGGSCTCEAGHDGCYHEALLALAVMK